MGTRKCCVSGCTSQEDQEKDKGVTFHRFPQNNSQVEKWQKAAQLENNFKPTKNTYVCSRHFKRENFTSQLTGKIVLKCLTVPSIFPWNKSSIVVTKTISPATSKPPSPPPSDKQSSDEAKVTVEEPSIDASSSTPAPIVKATSFTKKKKTSVAKSPIKPNKVSKRLSAKRNSGFKAKPESPPKQIPEAVLPAIATPKKKNLVVNFVPGTSIEAQNFDGKWLPVKVIEVDMEDREVLVRSNDKNKSKTGINDEWISMDSPRLRPAQPVVTYDVGEKVLARWNDCRKFPATIKRILENDTYDVLFDDGYPKIVRGIHINKYTGKNMPRVSNEEPTTPTLINPMLLNPPSLIPDYIKEMKDIAPPPTEGDWCCTWVDDIPVGQESSFDGPHGKLPSIYVHDYRVKEGWQKHIYLKQNGKWDILFISPTNRKLRFKNEIKKYLAEIGEIYDPNIWDFSTHKKLSRMRGLCIVSDHFKNQMLLQKYPSNQDTSSTSYDNHFASLGALPYVQPNLVLPPPTETEIRVGSLKVKVVDNIYQCPQEKCDKTFRKENHLQLHIKHYHEDLAKLMGECLNMEDLAYLRTTENDEPEISPPKTSRKSHGPKTRTREMNDSFKEIHVKTEMTPSEMKFVAQRSPILEEALKAPIIAGLLANPVKIEKELEIKLERTSIAGLSSMQAFDPETLIPPHSVMRPATSKFSQNRKRMRARFNPKTKKSGYKKQRFNFHNYDNDDVASSSIPGIIPYHEGPYFKNQASNFIDESGEVIKIVRMKKEEIINCICGYGEEDGLMIQCELCLCWQHGLCNGIENSHNVPEKYVCAICKNPLRQRSSLKYIHDQEWLFDGKLPIADYHAPIAKQPARFDTLKQCHTLIGNLMEMKRFMNSLDVKVNIAEKQGHPKLYLWAKKWEQSPPRVITSDTDLKDDVKRDIKFENDVDGEIRMPIIPEPELAIEPAKCQQTLIDHIQYQQSAVNARLDTIDAEITALEEANDKKFSGKVAVDEPKMKQTLFMLINDLMKMNELAAIHRN